MLPRARKPNTHSERVIVRSLSARRSRVIVALCSFTVALSLVACLTALPAAVAQPAPKHYAQVLKACPAPAPGNATCFALVRKPVASPAPGKAPSAGAQPFVVGGGAASVGPAGAPAPKARDQACCGGGR